MSNFYELKKKMIKAWVQCIGILNPLRLCHVSNFIPFLSIRQYLNEKNSKKIRSVVLHYKY